MILKSTPRLDRRAPPCVRRRQGRSGRGPAGRLKRGQLLPTTEEILLEVGISWDEIVGPRDTSGIG
jgi:hypothetical protein